MAATRGQRMETDEEVRSVSEVYDLPVPTRCRTAVTPFCRYVPFMPSYVDRDITGKLRRALGGICRRCRPAANNCV